MYRKASLTLSVSGFLQRSRAPSVFLCLFFPLRKNEPSSLLLAMQKGINNTDNGKCFLGMLLAVPSYKRNKMCGRLENTFALGTYSVSGSEADVVEVAPSSDNKLVSFETELGL